MAEIEHGYWTRVGMPCPHCQSTATVHTGMLTQDMPDAPLLDPAVEILRCRNCRREFRVDGEPFDSAARARAWYEHGCRERGLTPAPMHERAA